MAKNNNFFFQRKQKVRSRTYQWAFYWYPSYEKASSASPGGLAHVDGDEGSMQILRHRKVRGTISWYSRNASSSCSLCSVRSSMSVHLATSMPVSLIAQSTIIKYGVTLGECSACLPFAISLLSIVCLFLHRELPEGTYLRDHLPLGATTVDGPSGVMADLLKRSYRTTQTWVRALRSMTGPRGNCGHRFSINWVNPSRTSFLPIFFPTDEIRDCEYRQTFEPTLNLKPSLLPLW